MQQPVSPVMWLADELAARWGQALEGMTGEKPSVECSSLSDPAASDIEWWEQSLSFPPGAVVYAGATGPDAIALGGTVLEAAGIEVTPDDAKGSYNETLSQALSGLGQALTVRLRKEVTCPSGRMCSPPGAKATGYTSIRLTMAGRPPIDLLAAFDPVLVASLERENQPLRKAAAAGITADSSPINPSSTLPASPRTLDLLYDVELPVSVSFGRAQLPLKDVIKLTSGSIVELNRAVTEPVEVIVNNCVIARGEVVVIEGNYGVRIDQIISRQDRLRTLK